MKSLACSLIALALVATSAAAQEMPADYEAVLDTLGRQGDFKDAVLKVNIPLAGTGWRSPLTSSALTRPPEAPTPSRG